MSAMIEPVAIRHGDRRKSLCPVCGLARGTPRSNAVAGGIQTLTLRCPHCTHECLEMQRAAEVTRSGNVEVASREVDTLDVAVGNG